MAPQSSSDQRQRARHEPFFDFHPQTGVSIEVFYADPALEIFGSKGCGWFWWPRQPGSPPEGRANGPFVSSYAFLGMTRMGAMNGKSMCGIGS